MDLVIFIYILAATVINGLLGLVGVFTLWVNEKSLKRMLIFLVAFAAGAMLAGGFFHMIGEAMGMMEANTLFSLVMVGFIAFFFMERILHWHHCHDGVCDVHPYTQMALFGDGIHNFVDGLVIAGSFLISVPFGVLTTLIIISHEIPQELGNYGILIYGGFKRKKALLYNLIAQLTAVLGGIFGFFFLFTPETISYLLPFAGGGFIYIACSDLIPELHKETNLKRSMLSMLFIIIGIVFVVGVKVFLGG